ncbi:PREDICTED: condensin-2 complex subunit H2-like isoform X2 [Branchiostoma belcheri]|uniref:Condensin-2 complex subunit H2 n=1 Tax=Branchiostoma belcheri TaxID=7741 RepID=A0A6P5A4V8_BRABE|nr:PREDICTED: condensin-2 complex subunit H2-like isoform X2 [Branchiostoma belcheri]
MTLSQEQNAVDKRFAHLLQPIKDLTKNWDVNLASELENYLEELNTIPFSFDGGLSTMNFVEAALLIQGSACVYSRKVELLYTLVYQSLEMLASKKRQKQGSSLDEDGQDKDAPANKGWEEPEFLSLDDDVPVQPSKRGIELKPDQNKNVVIVQRVPMALTPLEEGEKKDAELVSKKGDTLGSRMDFTVNFALLHSPDTLMLDRSNCSKLNLTEDPRWTTPGKEAGDLQAVPGTEILPPPPDDLPVNTSMCSDDGGADPLPLGDDPVDMGDGGGDDLEWDNPERNAASEPRNLRPRVHVVEPKEQVKNDPWKLLDPHEEQPITNMRSLPFKKGVPFQVLPGLSGNAKKRKLKAASTQLEPLPDLISKTLWGDKKLPTNPTKRPTFAALEHLYWDAMKKRRQLEKQLETEAVPEYLEEEEEEQEAPGFPALDHDDDDDGDNDFGGLEIEPVGTETEAAPPMPTGLEELPKDSMVQTYEDMVRQYVDGFLESAQYIQETQLSRRIREWEEKILPHLEEEERHGPFDIHSCADQTLERFHTVGEVRPLHEVCRGQAAWGVCRTFAASLQLANNMNLEIGQTGVVDSALNTMTLTLLSKERAQERFQDYQAPSLTQKSKKGHK